MVNPKHVCDICNQILYLKFASRFIIVKFLRNPIFFMIGQRWARPIFSTSPPHCQRRELPDGAIVSHDDLPILSSTLILTDLLWRHIEGDRPEVHTLVLTDLLWRHIKGDRPEVHTFVGVYAGYDEEDARPLHTQI